MRRTENCESHPIDPHYIIPIDFNNMQKFPVSHTWSMSSIDNKPLISLENFVVPVIDMNDLNALHLMKKACEEWGMFQIINHNIEVELFQQLEDQMRKLFSLPTNQKQQALRLPDGVTGYGIIKISSFFNKQMWSEGFTIPGSPLELARSLWPQECTISTTFCNVINDYKEALNRLLGVTYDDVKWSRTNGSICPKPILQLTSYPICPDPSKTMGMAPHTDSSLLTLLYQSNTSGLQVFLDKAGWITVEPIPGALVVNVGDLFYILSNGIFKSALHQVKVNHAQQRFSAAFFFGPPKDVEISSAKMLVEPNKLPLFHPITWEKYLNLKGFYFDKAMDHIRVDPTKVEV